jgi:gluconate 5-dehydrogenase
VSAVSGLEELFGLRGRVALVAGASSGLGAEAARALARAGADVGLVARRRERLEELARELEKLGVRACAAPADVTVTAEIRGAVDHVETALGPIGILVNSAGIAPLGRAERHTREKWDAALGVNLTAAFELSQVVGERMIARGGGGRIIHVSSVMGAGGNAVHRAVGYTVTKHGMNGLVRQLAIEWAHHGITVNAVAPAYFPTEMTIDPALGDVAEDQKTAMRRFSPLDRLGRPGELETAILFLAAPGSGFVTGAIVPVDGGWTAW